MEPVRLDPDATRRACDLGASVLRGLALVVHPLELPLPVAAPGRLMDALLDLPGVTERDDRTTVPRLKSFVDGTHVVSAIRDAGLGLEAARAHRVEQTERVRLLGLAAVMHLAAEEEAATVRRGG